MALVIGGLVAASAAALLAWTAAVQARASVATEQLTSLHQAADAVAALLRQAGAAGRPALAQGTNEAVTLCGVRDGMQVWRGVIRVGAQGRLVVEPIAAPRPATSSCPGTDLTSPRVLAPAVRVTALTWGYYTGTGGSPVTGCGGNGQPRCSEVRAVTFALTGTPPMTPGYGRAGAPVAVGRVVTLRNPGLP